MSRIFALPAHLVVVAALAALTGCGGSDEPVVNQAPVASIASPADGSTFQAGDTITFAGGATDSEEGVLVPAMLV